MNLREMLRGARVLAALEEHGDAEGRLDWRARYVDRTVAALHEANRV
jgi:hypothetical protein